MFAKIKEKEKAIKLRKEGLSYREILKEIPVAKSTLSLWLRSVGLSERQKQRLTDKKMASIKRGWAAWHNIKLATKNKIIEDAKKQIDKISKKELRLIGIALYWCEGHKEKKKCVQAELSNSDPLLIKIFLKWLFEICEIPKSELYFRIFLHESSRHRLDIVRKFWSDATGFSLCNFQKVSWKKNKVRTKRTNIGENYFGLLRVTVKKSGNLNRKIQGWIKGICESCRVV